MGCNNTKPEGDSSAAAPASGATKLEDVKLTEPGQTSVHGRKLSVTGRRRAIRGEGLEDMSVDYKLVSVAKDDEAKQRIREYISKNELLKGLDEEKVQILVDAFSFAHTEAGDTIIQEGEDGDQFYLVDAGSYDVYLKSVGDKSVLTYGKGDSFGELALLYNSPRAATVKCSAKGALWCLERHAFRHVMIHADVQANESAHSFLKAVPILSGLTDQQRAVLAGCLEEVNFDPGEYIVEQSQVADAMYFVKKGEVVCHVKEDGAKRELMRIDEAGFFGESCLGEEKEALRKANVVAVTNVTVLKLTKANFQMHLGDLTDVVNKNLKLKVMESLEINGTRLWPQLSIEDQELLLGKLEEKAIPIDTEIIKQGEANNTFYIVKSGSVRVLQVPESGMFRSPRQLATLSAGQFFGERALLLDEPASATVKADINAVVYKCDRETFTAIFGPLQELLDAEVKRRDEMAQRPAMPEWKDLEIRRILGVGTFGRVKLVLHKPTKQTFALKCMRKAQVVQMKQQTHIMHEKSILAMMNHPFILRLVGTYQDKGELYMLLEVALGGELFTLLSKKAPLPDYQARFYVAQVVSIFSYMHGLSVVYRDLKPENLLLDNVGYLKMVDFGFAKVLKDRTYTLCGTPEYLAPEIILNKGHGFGADWWCTGILSFECLTGSTPFYANDPMDGYRKIMRGRVPWPHSIHGSTRDFIDKVLCTDPSKRLGCLKGGSLDVRHHDWFKGLDWKQLNGKKISAPFVPKIKSATDDSNFDHYQDDGKRNYPQENFPHDMFKEFADVWV